MAETSDRAGTLASPQNLLVLAAAVVFFVVVASWHAPGLVSNDGVQYLEGARSLAAGRGFETGVLIYDPHFASGRIPAEQTTFPPGFSAFTVPLLWLGLSPIAAGILVSFIAAVATALMVARALGGVTGAALGAVSLLNLQGALLTTIVSSDVVFTALVLATLLQVDRGLESGRRADLLWGGVAAAVAVACRFAGAFLLFALVVALGARFLRRRDRGAFLDGVAAILPGVLVFGGLLLRNYLLTGDADGGALDDFVRPWGQVFGLFFWGGVTLFGVASPGGPAFVAQLTLVGAAIGLAAWSVSRRRSEAVIALRGLAGEPLVRLCLVFAMVYVGVLLHLSHTRNSIVLLPRYLLPVLPPALLVVGRLFERLHATGALTSSLRASIAVSLAAGLLVGSWSYLPEARRTYLDGNPVQEAAAVLDAPVPGGRTVLEAFQDLVPEGEPVLTEPGHSLGFLLGRPALGPIGPAYSGRSWDAGQIRELARRYGARHAVLLQGQSQPTDSPSFWVKVRAEGPPPWLVPVLEAPHLTVFRIEVEATPARDGEVR